MPQPHEHRDKGADHSHMVAEPSREVRQSTRVQITQTFHDRTGKPVVGRQSSSSFVPSVIKTDVLLDNDDRAHKDLCKNTENEKKSYHNKTN